MRLKKLTKLLLVMVISLMTILALSVCASADVNNGTGGGQAGIENAKKGIGVDDIGYRFYLTDLEGKLISDEYGPCVINVMGSKTSDHFDNVFTDALKYNMTRVTESTVSGFIETQKNLPAGCPKAMVVSGSNFVGNGAAFKNWMASACTIDSSCKTNAYYIVKKYFGAEMLKEFGKGKYKLVAEPIVLCPLYGDYSTTQDIYGNGVQAGPNSADPQQYSSYSGFWMFGTFYEMALANDQLSSITGVPHSGRTAGYMMPVKDALGECMYLEADDLELKAPGNVSGVAGNIHGFIHWDMRNGNISTLKNIGLGLHVYYTEPSGVIHTYDIGTNPDKPAPAETPDEENDTAGDKQIIKCYLNVAFIPHILPKA